MEAKRSLLFFSYARADAEFALKLAKSLRSAGANLWIDQLDIQAGDHWDRAVEQALMNAESILVILSPTAVDSKNVMDEVSFALDKNKRIVPVLYQACTIPFRLRRLQHVDFTADFSQGLERLLGDLGLKRSSEETQTAQTMPSERPAQPHLQARPEEAVPGKETIKPATSELAEVKVAPAPNPDAPVYRRKIIGGIVVALILVIFLYYMMPPYKISQPPAASQIKTPHAPAPAPSAAPTTNAAGPRIIRATGMGVAREDITNPVQRKLMAIRAAEIIAKRDLAQVIKGVMIDSKSTVQKQKITEDVINSITEALVMMAQIVETKYNPDHGIAEVVVETTIPAATSAANAAGPRIIRVTGMGFAGEDITNPVQRKLMAIRAAEVIAQRNAAEFIKGALIYSRLTVQQLELTDDVITSRTEAIIRNARIVERNYNPDDGSAEVVMEATFQQ